MSTLLNTLGIDRLSVEERLQLIQEIWDSLDTDAETLPLTEAQKRELDRRIAALDADPSSAVAWEDVEARALARLKR
jgi:putative addiction module component (TIGR02574 family)